ncbi:MFS transporter [Burkholderia multivorans]|uniref:MFS transporter n=1 Tax=Burkholderia multivorans TaxID=87883 RepID=UPI001D00338C|nr:MFS transporter [Burkholderia multivorans]MCO1438208.1 MFS transporter [Burkholderia multivorans]MDN7508733.1 MFS transporter [Burkholderia multivorans]UQN57411.1 MFS transporter [Burkholderia multivorans]UQN64172.1 MFS transporter [Burkholderia multivorans]UQO09540.1 MFS transporter [Burkholderia multivorans]
MTRYSLHTKLNGGAWNDVAATGDVMPAPSHSPRKAALADPCFDARAPERASAGLRRWIAVALFSAAFALAYLDRQILTLLIDPVRQSLGLSDTQVGLLQGLAFALCFAIGGIPLGWLVDHCNRVRVAAGCIALWSVATASSGLAGSYVQLLAVRSVTALSEAGCSPAALSIFADQFPPRQLPRATAIYTAAPYIGGSASLMAGGVLLGYFSRTGGLDLPWLGHLQPWQAVFTVVGVPGLILALLILAGVREPSRVNDMRLPEARVSLGDVSRFVAQDAPHLRGYFCAYACILAAFFSVLTWYPTFAVRNGFGPGASLGPMLGTMFLVCGLAGSLSGQCFVGRVADSQIVARVMRVTSGVTALLIPAAIVLALVPRFAVSLAGYGAMVFLISMTTSLMPIPLQVGVPNRMRGRVIGCFIFGVNVVGTGVGPLAVGAISDHIAGGRMDGHALAVALAIVVVVSASGAFIAMRRALARQIR